MSVPQVTLCLTMIIKNESRIIERCLDSVKDICDYMTICDTGSTDGTQEIVKAYFEKHNIRGYLFHHEWKNFGHNRSLSIDAAKTVGATYILTIDADMCMEVVKDKNGNSTFDKQSLSLDSYMLVQRNSSLFYHNTRIMRSTLPWECIGVTHEYWGCKGYHTEQGTLDSLVINDLGDGGCKSDKFERDIRLLTQGLVDEPDNIRYLFYLAQSYKDIGDKESAIVWYKKRIEAGGWDQEIWYSKYMIGHCYEHQGNWPLALDAYLEAYNYMPSRAETLHKVVKKYRAQGKHRLAMAFCEMGLEIPFPNNRPLFCALDVYVSGFLYEFSILAYYVNKKAAGLLACEKLLHRCLPWKQYTGDESRGHLSNSEMETTRNNRLFYIEAFEAVEKTQLSLSLKEGWSICNPNLTVDEHGKPFLFLRSVNYRLDDKTGDYLWPFGFVDTETYVSPLTWPTFRQSTNVIQERKSEMLHHATTIDGNGNVNVVATLPPIFPSSVRNYEDVRAFQCRGKWYATATSREMNKEAIAEVVLLHLSCKEMEKVQVPCVIDKVVRLRGYEDEKYQKNWMPFIDQDECYFVYMCDPLTILQADLETGQVKVVKKEKSSHLDMSSYRGSSAGISWRSGRELWSGHGFLFLIHEVTHQGKLRVYTHRFVYMSCKKEGWTISCFSKPFHFFGRGVEFVTGMVHGPQGELYIGVGKNDREAWIFQTSFNKVESMLGYSRDMLDHTAFLSK